MFWPPGAMRVSAQCPTNSCRLICFPQGCFGHCGLGRLWAARRSQNDGIDLKANRHRSYGVIATVLRGQLVPDRRLAERLPAKHRAARLAQPAALIHHPWFSSASGAVHGALTDSLAPHRSCFATKSPQRPPCRARTRPRHSHEAPPKKELDSF